MIDAANLAWGNFPLLSHGATEALIQHGEDWQSEVFLKPLVEGRWTGTMCLTEPHCVTYVVLMKTRAVASDAGSYEIPEHTIFIPAAEPQRNNNNTHPLPAHLPEN